MKHYRVVPFDKYRNETATKPKSIMDLSPSFIEAYLKKVERSDECWLFKSKSKEKWPRFRGYLAHRIAYTIYKGTIPEGLTVDHLCFNRWCQNPNHLELTSIVENSKRYISSLACV